MRRGLKASEFVVEGLMGEAQGFQSGLGLKHYVAEASDV